MNIYRDQTMDMITVRLRIIRFSIAAVKNFVVQILHAQHVAATTAYVEK